MAAPLIQIDARRALRSLGRVGPALHHGTVRGINDVAFGAMRFEKGQLPRRLDRPSTFTARGVQVDRAAATQATPEAVVKVSDQRAKYLQYAEFGGKLTKANAGASRGSGSEAIVIPIAEIVQNNLGSAGRGAVKRALKLPRTFLARMNNQLHGGVWQRNESGRGIKPLLLFSDTVDFKAPPLHFRDDVGGFAGPRIRAAVAMRVDRELSRAVRS
ncbi:hypothetical protein NZL82_01685 [Sphingomonas sanguinis]|uniref:hypothetical protein n=1 Tax=Sphingomonas sp. LC-1 TaxID=3110957 RepID=UPI0021BA4E21|nr:hypothetical protein [Sphingomonas sp. LC-1]MCT8000583.1 hypothetical protein [Sphingomonas sp. LC-1]